MEKIKCLDKGEVEYYTHSGDDLLVVNSARVSFNKRKEVLEEDDVRLIRYLAKHKHWTPFAHPQITLKIKAPIFVRTQLFKHKVGFVENEVSRRYVDDMPEFYFPKSYRRKPEGSIKQGSGDYFSDEKNKEFRELVYGVHHEAFEGYMTALNKGMAPEQARGMLPQDMYTEWFWTGSLSSYARVYKQRTDSHAQKETQEYGHAIGKIMEELYPVSWKALNEM